MIMALTFLLVSCGHVRLRDNVKLLLFYRNVIG